MGLIGRVRLLRGLIGQIVLAGTPLSLHLVRSGDHVVVFVDDHHDFVDLRRDCSPLDADVMRLA